MFADWAFLLPHVPLKDTKILDQFKAPLFKIKSDMKWDLSQGLNKQNLMLSDRN